MEQLQETPPAGAEACGEVRSVRPAGEERFEDRIGLLLRLKAQTHQQLLEYKSMIDANEEKTPDEIMQEKQIEVKIESLENEIEDVKSKFEMKSLALNRMKLSVALKNSMENMDTGSSVLTDDMKHILKLHKIIMKSQEESSELEKKLLEVRKKRLQLKQASRSKLLEIQTEKNKQKEDLDNMENSETIKTMKENLQREIKITTVIQHTFQGLIIGSKVNWAEDPALKEIVLQLEKDLTTI
ncbi:centromere protein H [Psammomys obesus]|uniref:centromere protein H n=1 Tax=Psammomys obesus TaxID=48139 RepID=UPI00245335E4|nr:centromere protein H [Psammomys obesus]